MSNELKSTGQVTLLAGGGSKAEASVTANWHVSQPGGATVFLHTPEEARALEAAARQIAERMEANVAALAAVARAA